MKEITIEEYLAMEEKKVVMQNNEVPKGKIWYLTDDDDEDESYVLDFS